MPSRYGIDTSVLVRLITAEPRDAFAYCEKRLTALANDGSEVFASNQVIGEAYIVVQHHYGVSSADARVALLRALRSGLVAPLNGRSVLAALEAQGGPGLFDRLIADGYSNASLETLTLDRRMVSLSNVRPL